MVNGERVCAKEVLDLLHVCALFVAAAAPTNEVNWLLGGKCICGGSVALRVFRFVPTKVEGLYWYSAGPEI